MTLQNVPSRWAERLTKLLPQLEECAGLLDDATLMLHGSTSRGVDDSCSDLDVWLLPSAELPPKFIQFTLDGKPGHVNIESAAAFADRIRRCDFPLIYELRHALLMQDPDDVGEDLIATARRPMPTDVRAAWFAHHYIEMRSEHRACDSPITRGDSIALLLALQPTLSHALQAAMVLDGVPYPYSKWLPSAAAQTPTGAKVVPLVQRVIGLLGERALTSDMPEPEHPLTLALKQIRQVLIDAARAGGLDEPWLREWWLHLPLRRRIETVTWAT